MVNVAGTQNVEETVKTSWIEFVVSESFAFELQA